MLAAALAWWVTREHPQPATRKAASTQAPCEQRRFEGSLFTVCRYDARRHALALFVDEGGTPLRSFARLEAHLGPRAGRLLFAMNAGMYDEEGMPIGLYVENGRQRHKIALARGPGNFGMKPNGVLAADAEGRLSVETSEKWAKAGRRAVWATQSGPMLVIDGKLHPMIAPNGSSLHVRNGVGRVDAQTGWFAISEEPVSFGRFARFFRDSLGCRDALYFDGAVSSLWEPATSRRDDGYELGPMVAVFARP